MGRMAAGIVAIEITVVINLLRSAEHGDESAEGESAAAPVPLLGKDRNCQEGTGYGAWEEFRGGRNT